MKKIKLFKSTTFLASLILTITLFTGCATQEPATTSNISSDTPLVTTHEPIQESVAESTVNNTVDNTAISSAATDSVAKSDLQAVSYVRAKDGDTIVVNDGTNNITVRLIGIDTPESVHPDQSKNTIQGKNASEYTKNLLSNYSTLYLEYDVSNTDKYGRTLAYVWLTPDTTNYSNMLNYKLLEDGWAVAKEYKPNVKYSNIFKAVTH